ncbi:porin [Duganella radicis]|uniref:porin n=1 Tax=Duganella radicis TaxID=551988 RepID=UPI0014791F87|nr:porin [Duganella radicis]
MKNYLCKAAVAAAVATLASAAQAQTSVNVFGLLDVSLKSVNTGGVSAVQMATDGMLNSRLGFRADEDLGDGMKAGVWMEMAPMADSGNMYPSGKLWHRRSTVSLSGGFGELRLGRDLNPTFYNLCGFDPFTAVGVGAGFNLITNLGSGAATLLRTDNAVSYFLPPDLGGWYGQVQVAPGEGVAGNRYGGLRIGYQKGPWNTAFAYARTGTASGDDFKLANAGASYDAGVVKLMVLLNSAEYGALKQTNWELGASMPVGARGLVRASYQRANPSGAGTDANSARQAAIGYVYTLSRRTSLYATYSHLSNSGAAAFKVGTPPNAVAGARSSGFELGVMHSF